MNTTKPGDKAAVKQYALMLFAGTTGALTTLEVKNSMRNDDYWIDQKDVSKWMRELADENSWKSDTVTGPHGTYIEYRVQQIGSAKARRGRAVKITVYPLIKSGGDNRGLSNADIDALVAAGSITNNDWLLSTCTGAIRMIYPGTESRDHVRTTYSRESGWKIQNTRACRIKTMKVRIEK